MLVTKQFRLALTCTEKETFLKISPFTFYRRKSYKFRTTRRWV